MGGLHICYFPCFPYCCCWTIFLGSFLQKNVELQLIGMHILKSSISRLIIFPSQKHWLKNRTAPLYPHVILASKLYHDCITLCHRKWEKYFFSMWNSLKWLYPYLCSKLRGYHIYEICTLEYTFVDQCPCCALIRFCEILKILIHCFSRVAKCKAGWGLLAVVIPVIVQLITLYVYALFHIYVFIYTH